MLLPDGRLWWARRLGEEFFREEGRSRLGLMIMMVMVMVMVMVRRRLRNSFKRKGGAVWATDGSQMLLCCVSLQYPFRKIYFKNKISFHIYMRVGMDPSLPAYMSMECSHKMRT